MNEAKQYMITDNSTLKQQIETFAATISSQQLGIVEYSPEPWAKPLCCFDNAAQKAQMCGGDIQYGWIFQHKMPSDILDQYYLAASHHAVWHNATDGKLIDVTPLNLSNKSHPLMPNCNSIIFLVDDSAKSIKIKNSTLSLPIRFFALGDNELLNEYVQTLILKETSEYKIWVDQLTNAT